MKPNPAADQVMSELRSLATFYAGCPPTKSKGASGRTRMIKMAHVSGSIAKLTDEDLEPSTDAGKRVQEGDVVVVARGASVRAAVAEPSHHGALLGPNLIGVRLRPDALAPRLLARFLELPAVATTLLAKSQGMANKGFGIPDLAALKVRVPPAREQEALVDLLAAAHEHREAVVAAADLRLAAASHEAFARLSGSGAAS